MGRQLFSVRRCENDTRRGAHKRQILVWGGKTTESANWLQCELKVKCDSNAEIEHFGYWNQ